MPDNGDFVVQALKTSAELTSTTGQFKGKSDPTKELHLTSDIRMYLTPTEVLQ